MAVKQLNRSNRCTAAPRMLASVGMVLWICVGVGQACGQDSTTDQPTSSSVARSSQVQFGIAGHYRVGCWTAVRLSDELANAMPHGPIDLETQDGDGMRVSYRQPAPSRHDPFTYVIPGTEAVPLVIRSDDATLLSTRFPIQRSPSRGPAMIPLGMSWIVSIGDPLAVDVIGANELLKRDPLLAVSKPDSADLPDEAIGYDGVDLVMITGSGSALLGELNQQQSAALKQWVLEGGRLFLTLGASAPDLASAAPWLFDLLPLAADQLTVRDIDPTAIEIYTNPVNPLKPYAGVMLPKGQGRILITGRTTRRVSTPLAAEYRVGFGKVTVIAADLESPLFAQWPERTALITRLTGSVLIPPDDRLSPTNQSTAFDDLAGQMRATLDQFPLKRQFGFSLIALILMALVAAIGPLDYLLINRLLGRPLLGWLTFPLVAIGLSAILIHQARPVVATTTTAATDNAEALVRCNRFEVIDIDTLQNVGRGFGWSYLYTHPAGRFDMSVKPSAALAKISGAVDAVLTSPFGYPGRAFGGIQISDEGTRFPPYQVKFKSDQQSSRATLSALSLAPRSSKSIATSISFQPQVAKVVMSRRPGSELLNGELLNPLPVDLLDGMLVYKNWAYLLPTRFPAGSKIDSIGTLQQKPFRRKLTRQMLLEKSKTETEAWVPSRFDQPARVAEMLMFHAAAGGEKYTNLKHQPLAFLDVTDQLFEDRCLLVGRVSGSWTEPGFASIDSGNAEPITVDGQQLTMIRVFFPVETRRVLD